MQASALAHLQQHGYDTFFAITQSPRGRGFSRVSIITRNDLLDRELTLFELEILHRMTRDAIDIACDPATSTLSLAAEIPSHQLRHWLPFFLGLIDRWGTTPLFAISRTQ